MYATHVRTWPAHSSGSENGLSAAFPSASWIHATPALLTKRYLGSFLVGGLSGFSGFAQIGNDHWLGVNRQPSVGMCTGTGAGTAFGLHSYVERNPKFATNIALLSERTTPPTGAWQEPAMGRRALVQSDTGALMGASLYQRKHPRGASSLPTCTCRLHERRRNSASSTRTCGCLRRRTAALSLDCRLSRRRLAVGIAAPRAPLIWRS